jgi:signal transduction histidine kinase
MQQTRQQESALKHIPPIRVDLLSKPSECHHIVQFYENDEFVGEVLSHFIGVGLSRGDAAVVIAAEPRRRRLLKHLVDEGFNVEAARRAGLLTVLDARQTLDRLLTDGRPDTQRFNQTVGGMLQQSASIGHRGAVRVYGEMVNLLCEDGNSNAALELEQLWSDLTSRHSFSLLCAYDIANFHRAADDVTFQQVCRAHTDVIPTESYPHNEAIDHREREISRLQQRARALETEIGRREQLEEALRDRLRDLERTKEALRAQREELAEALRTRDEFLSIASHELRNPLNALQLQVASLQRAAERATGSLAPEWVFNRLKKVREQVVRLGKLIDTFLEVSKITAGKLELEVQKLDFATVVRGAVEQSKHESPSLLLLRAPDSIPGCSDPLRLEQVVANLLSNAIRYGAGQPIEVSVAAQGDRVLLQVSDCGIGIAPEVVSRIFDRFERATPIRKFGGLGLGLWMNKQIVEALHGRISVESTPGRGSTFTVDLPRYADSSPEHSRWGREF